MKGKKKEGRRGGGEREREREWEGEIPLSPAASIPFPDFDLLPSSVFPGIIRTAAAAAAKRGEEEEEERERERKR